MAVDGPAMALRELSGADGRVRTRHVVGLYDALLRRENACCYCLLWN
jgi:hypothetical protein